MNSDKRNRAGKAGIEKVIISESVRLLVHPYYPNCSVFIYVSN
ncbi:hypothetical protein ACFLWS_04575 [Chloroflexota bacterium]